LLYLDRDGQLKGVSSPPNRPKSGTRPLLGRVLVVEDDDGMLEAFRDFLEEEGYSVRCARNGVEALAVLRSEPITVVLLDLQMPVMDGRELRRHQLEDPRLAEIPVVLVTANPRETIEGLRVIRKPFDGDELLRVVKEQHGLREARKTQQGKRRALRAQATVVVGDDDTTKIPSCTKTAGRVPLGPVESFFVSKIDGKRSIADLAALVAFEPKEAASIVRRLVEIGVVELLAPPVAETEEDDVDEGWDVAESGSAKRS